VKAFGRVLDPAPLIAMVAEAETARAALAASEKDAARVKKLFDEGTNASSQVLEAAKPPPCAIAPPSPPRARGSFPAGAARWPTVPS